MSSTVLLRTLWRGDLISFDDSKYPADMLKQAYTGILVRISIGSF